MYEKEAFLMCLDVTDRIRFYYLATIFKLDVAITFYLVYYTATHLKRKVLLMWPSLVLCQ